MKKDSAAAAAKSVVTLARPTELEVALAHLKKALEDQDALSRLAEQYRVREGEELGEIEELAETGTERGPNEIERAIQARDAATAAFSAIARRRPPAPLDELRRADQQRQDAELQVRAIEARAEQLVNEQQQAQRSINALETRVRELQLEADELSVDIVNRDAQVRAQFEKLQEEWHRLKQRAAALGQEEAHVAALRGSLIAIVGEAEAARLVDGRVRGSARRFAGVGTPTTLPWYSDRDVVDGQYGRKT